MNKLSSFAKSITPTVTKQLARGRSYHQQGTMTKLYFLSIYRATPEVPLSTQSIDQITHRGRLLSLDTSRPDASPTTIADNLHMPDGITISRSQNRIFWTQMGNPLANDGCIMSSALDGTDVQSLLCKGTVHTPKQIVLDPSTSSLYFSDREGLRVHRCSTTGEEHQVLIQTGDWLLNKDQQLDQTRWCVGMAISKKLAKVFWTQKGAPKSKQGRIFSANLTIPEGETAQSRSDIQLVAEGLPEPIDLEVDEDEGALYWTDRGEFPYGNTLNKKTIVGEVPEAEKVLGREILAEGFAEAIGLALDRKNGCAYVADLGGRVWRSNIRRPSRKEKVYEDELGVFTGIAVAEE